ncbi:hypothetical protein ACRJ4B_06015 [Streptomyces sp. GTA36]
MRVRVGQAQREGAQEFRALDFGAARVVDLGEFRENRKAKAPTREIAAGIRASMTA